MPNHRATTLLRSLLLRCSAPLFAATLAGCFNLSGPPSSRIEASDSGVFVPAIRVSADFRGDGAPSQPRSGHGVEAGWSSGSGGGDRQTLASGYWNVESEREETGISPIKVKLSGPSLGLDLALQPSWVVQN